MKVYIEVYGCTANKGDASLIRGVLSKNAHEIVNIVDEADVIVVITCTVISTTEQKILSRLRELKRYCKKIIIAGCMASVQTGLIKNILPDAIFLPPNFSHHIDSVLKGEKVDFIEGNKTRYPKSYNDIFAPINIAEGCIFSCSYCITTLARGRLKSYPIEEIMDDVKSALSQDCKEIQLTAQDASSYGLDINTNLGELISAVTELDENFRLRIGMMNPYTVSLNIDEITDSFQDKKVYNFIHIPIQSGDNELLERMNRKYSVEDFMDILNMFRKKLGNPTFSTDVIVGFPSETDFQFQKTLELIKEIKPDITNITRFSARPNTSAKKMDGRIKTEVVKQRSKILTKTCLEISKEKNFEHLGKTYRVLTTEIGKYNTVVGRSEDYKPIAIKDKLKIGEFYSVEIVNASQTNLFGKLK